MGAKKLTKKKAPKSLKDAKDAKAAPRKTARTDTVELVIAVGLATLIFIRPWFDGFTFAEKNINFMWGIALFTLVWSAAALVRKQGVAGGAYLAFFAAFLAFGLLSAVSTARYDRTYLAMLSWSGHFMVFALACCAVRSKRALGIVLTAFAVTSMAEAVWSILHLEFVLPMTRRDMMRNPEMLLSKYFDTTTPTADLIDRLNKNRAFGSFLFPNALAGWLTMGIPFALGVMGHAIGKLMPILRGGADGPAAERPGEEEQSMRLRAMAAAAIAGFVLFLAIFTYYNVFFALRYLNAHWQDYMWRWVFYCAGIPVLGAGAMYPVARRYGIAGLWYGVVSVAGAFMFVLQCYVLWLTYSRGGMLATAASLSFCAVLMGYATWRSRGDGLRKTAAAAASALVILAAMGAAFWTVAGNAAHAQQRVPGAKQRQALEQAAPRIREEVKEEGTDVSWADLSNPATMALRLGYWQAGLRMVRDNYWTGVGFGNFSTLYPRYQVLGTGDVRQAHNDFLQIFSETGIFGLLSFTAFWGYFFIVGALRLLREREPVRRWLLMGLYGGVLAFVLHSVVDFDFVNASLAFTVFLLAGLFVSASRRKEDGRARAAVTPRVAVALVALFACIASAAAYPVYAQNNILGNQYDRQGRINAARMLLDMMAKHNPRDPRPLTMGMGYIAPLVSDQETLRQIGDLQQLLPDGRSFRPLGANEQTDLNTYLVVRDVRTGHAQTLEVVETWAEKTEEADALFPHIAEVAAELFQWNDTLAFHSPNEAEKQRYRLKSLKWAEEAVRRSPQQTTFRNLHGELLLREGRRESGPRQLEMFMKAVDELRMAARLYPTKPRFWERFAEVAIKMGEELRRVGKTEQGAELYNEGQKAKQRADALREALGKGGA